MPAGLGGLWQQARSRHAGERVGLEAPDPDHHATVCARSESREPPLRCRCPLPWPTIGRARSFRLDEARAYGAAGQRAAERGERERAQSERRHDRPYRNPGERQLTCLLSSCPSPRRRCARRGREIRCPPPSPPGAAGSRPSCRAVSSLRGTRRRRCGSSRKSIAAVGAELEGGVRAHRELLQRAATSGGQVGGKNLARAAGLVLRLVIEHLAAGR